MNLSSSELKYLISLLDAQDKRELVREFADTFKEMAKNGEITLRWYYNLLNKYAPSDDLVLKACQYDEKIVNWIINRVKMKIKKANEIIDKY